MPKNTERQPTPDHGLGQAELAVELERARLHAERAGRGPGLGGLVDEADANPEAVQPEGEHQAGRARPGDQYLGVAHGAPLRAASAGPAAHAESTTDGGIGAGGGSGDRGAHHEPWAGVPGVGWANERIVAGQAASAAKRETRVGASGRSANHAPSRSGSRAAAVATCCGAVLARPP